MNSQKNYINKVNIFMNLNLDLSSSRTTRVLDGKSQRTPKFLPSLKNNKIHSVNFKVKPKRSVTKQPTETHVRRYDENQSVTVLSIRFAQSEQKRKAGKDQETYIKSKSKDSQNKQQNEENEKQRILPYLKYRKYQSPQQRLKNMGYDPDVRLPEQIYSDKVHQKKLNYVNRLQALRRQMQNSAGDKRQNRMDRSRIQIKLLGEQIKRKRQRELLIKQQRKGQRLLQSLLTQGSQVMSA